MSPVIPEVSTSTVSSMIVLSVTSYAGTATSYDPPAPRPRSIHCGGQPPILPMTIPLPRFANKDFVPSPVRFALVATQPYPSSPKSHASTACVECSRSSDGHISVSPVGIDRVSVSSVDSGDNEQTNMAMELSGFQPLNRPQTPVNIFSHHIMRRRLCP